VFFILAMFISGIVSVIFTILWIWR
jgi:hypothetical protein